MPTSSYLLTGVTGGLGAKILHDMLHKHNVPARSIVATSRSESNRRRFESQGLRYAVADYKRIATLEAAFAGVEELLFMSSSERQTEVRESEHDNVVKAAKKAGVGRVWYVSLAFGGYSDCSKIGFQAAHYKTEELLRDSGLRFISLRAGVYSDAFPLFLNWYPSSKSVLMPKVSPSAEESKIAFTTRDELGEGIAAIIARGIESYPTIRPQTEKNIIMLTATEKNSLVDLVGAINAARPGQRIAVEYLEPQSWILECARNDEGGKGLAWFEARLVFIQGVSSGDAAVTSDALTILLGRKPETGTQAVERFVRESSGEYYWHQNHVGDWKSLHRE